MAQSKSRRRSADGPSILVSALLVFGMLLTLLGAVAALLGLGGFGQDAFSGLGFKVSSAGPGLVIATLGVVVIFMATRKMRGEIKVFGVAQRAMLDRVADIAPWLLAAVLLIDVATFLWTLLG